MRVTGRMMTDHLLRNLQHNLSRLDRLHEQLSSGKQIQRASDDPAKAGEIMRFRTLLTETEQYEKNIEDALSWINASDAALGEVTGALQRARELAVYGANEALPESARQAVADEVSQLIDHLVQVGNTMHGSRYLFAGNQIGRPPFVATKGTVPGAPGTTGPETVSVAYQGDQGVIAAEIGPGVTVQWNVAGDRALGDALNAVIALRDDLRAGRVGQVGGAGLGQLDAALDTVLRWRSDLGAKANRLEASRDRLQSLHTNISTLLSKTEDADIAKVVMELQAQESVYRAALASGARIVQPTLIDFLR